jgi:hypothetical protein
VKAGVNWACRLAALNGDEVAEKIHQEPDVKKTQIIAMGQGTEDNRPSGD